MPGQHGEVACQISRLIDDAQIASQPEGLGDHMSVLGVGLALTGESRAHHRHHPPGGVAHLLARLGEQRQQQRRRCTDDVDGPLHAVSQRHDRGDQLVDLDLVVQDPPRQQRRPGGVDDFDPVVGLADVDPGPDRECCRWHGGVSAPRAFSAWSRRERPPWSTPLTHP